MNKQDLIDPKFLCKILRYEANTGKLFWRHRFDDMFEADIYSVDRIRAAWNARFAGAEALTTIGSSGYYQGRVLGMPFRAHRVIWAMVHSEWPEDQVDHINHDRSDNRIVNLRVVTRLENQRNTAMRKNNKSGKTGVYFSVSRDKWIARIGIGGTNKHVGIFRDIEDAIRARIAAEVKYGYHENHGK